VKESVHDFTIDAICLNSQENNNYSELEVPIFISEDFSEWESKIPIKMSQNYDYRLNMRLRPNRSLKWSGCQTISLGLTDKREIRYYYIYQLSLAFKTWD